MLVEPAAMPEVPLLHTEVMPLRLALAVLAAFVALAASASAASHVVVIVMENKEYGQVIGSRSAPYVNSLARRYTSATSFYGVRHPSLPNYLALIAGSTLGVTSDCTGCQQGETSIVDQLETAGVPWKAYMQGMPSACFRGRSSGVYVKRHNPFMYFDRVANDPARCAKVVPARRLTADLRNDALPTFAWLTPGLCADTHDCSVAQGDRYLSKVVPPIIDALGPHGFLVLTWDEGSSNRRGGGRIPTILAGPDVKRRHSYRRTATHYATLATIEDALALPRLRRAAHATPLSEAFTRPPALRP